jgi:membrane protein
MVYDRIESAVVERAHAARARWRLVDHLWRTYDRYDGVYGTRLAAANAYYAFFAAFALGVLTFAVVGWAIPGGSDNAGLRAVQDYLSTNLPQLEAQSLTTASKSIGVLALVGLVIAGVGWVETLRSSQRAIWCLEQEPGHPVLRWLLDLAVLAGLGLLLLSSLAVSTGIVGVLQRLSREVGDVLPERATAGALDWTDTLLGAAIDLVLASALLAGVPRLRMTWRRLLPSALLVVFGFGVMKVVGRWFISRTQHNPAYENFAAAAAAVGLLLFMYLVHQVILFAAALAATSDRGRVLDLATRPAVEVDCGSDAEAARNPHLIRLQKE